MTKKLKTKHLINTMDQITIDNIQERLRKIMKDTMFTMEIVDFETSEVLDSKIYNYWSKMPPYAQYLLSCTIHRDRVIEEYSKTIIGRIKLWLIKDDWFV